MRIDVRKSREFQAAIIAVRQLDKTLRKMVRQHTKAIVEPAWSQALTRRASTSLERRVIVSTAVVAASDRNVTVRAASKGRPLSGGLNPKADYPAVEFGASQGTTTYRRRSPRGTTHTVTRHATRQLRARNANGYVFYPAAAEMVPRVAALFVQTVVKTIANAIEGKQE